MIREPVDPYYRQALGLVADELAKIPAEDFDARRWKFIAIIRNAAESVPLGSDRVEELREQVIDVLLKHGVLGARKAIDELIAAAREEKHP